MKSSSNLSWTKQGDDVCCMLPDGEEWCFSLPYGDGGYVYCDFGDRRASGTRGKQICSRGGVRGSTISTDTAHLLAVCKKWMRWRPSLDDIAKAASEAKSWHEMLARAQARQTS